MNSAPILNPLGIALGALFVLLMVGLLLWMFHVPAPVERAVARARRSVSGIKRIMVPTQGESQDERAVELACRLGQEQKSEIILTYVLEIPLTLSLGTALPEEERRAVEAMQRAIDIVKLHGLEAIARVERDREAGRGILRAAQDLSVDLLVIGMRPTRSYLADPLGHTTEMVLRRANFEVIIDKHPSAAAL
jgi:nucleotide-binding universal stress UspA family protein